MMNNTSYLIPVLLAFMSCSQGGLTVKEDDKLVFFGDSITELATEAGGFISLIGDSLSHRYPSMQLIGAGVSGNKVTDLQQRVDRDVLARKPNIVFIYIGINDVWHAILPGLRGTPKDEYASRLRDIIGRIGSTGARVILCTPSVIGEKWDGTNKLDKQLDEYAAIGRSIAKETGIELCDLRHAFIEYLKVNNPANKERGVLTEDSVHLNGEGNRLVAREMLKMLQ